MLLNQMHKKKWGHELWIVNNDKYCGKLLNVETHWQVSYHHHQIKHETFHILDGYLYFKYDGIEFKLKKGMTIVIPQNTYHSFAGLSTYPAVILEISTPHFEEDSYRLDQSHPIKHDEFLRMLELPYYQESLLHKDNDECECYIED